MLVTFSLRVSNLKTTCLRSAILMPNLFLSTQLLLLIINIYI